MRSTVLNDTRPETRRRRPEWVAYLAFVAAVFGAAACGGESANVNNPGQGHGGSTLPAANVNARSSNDTNTGEREDKTGSGDRGDDVGTGETDKDAAAGSGRTGIETGPGGAPAGSSEATPGAGRSPAQTGGATGSNVNRP
jgi:hypothetical protein